MSQNTVLARNVDVRAGGDAQRSYRGRKALNHGERALLAMIDDLSIRKGAAEPSVAYMAAALDVSPRQVQRMLNGERRTIDGQLTVVRAGLIERGYVAAMPRRGRSTLYRLCEQPVENSAQGVTKTSPPPLTKTSPPGVTKTSPICIESNRDSAQGVTFDQPQLWERVDFNVSRPLYAGDWMKFDQRVCVACNNWRLITHIEHQGKDRKILSCKRSSTALVLSLAPTGDEVAQELVIPFNRIIEQQFFRLRHARRPSRKEQANG